MNRPPRLTSATSRSIALALWLVACTAMIAVTWQFIVPMNFRDPDDALRLVQVRDLLAGQSWFDLVQHRIHPAEPVPMHWSRLVDLPIALVLAVLELFLSPELAERLTLVAVPLILLLVLAAVLYRIVRALDAGRGTALIAVAMLMSSLSILIQFAPMRIDHHGPQVLCGALALLALVRTERADGRHGLLAGTAMAWWLQISVEGLPYAVTAGAILGLRHVSRTDRWPDLRNYLVGLTGGSAVLLFATRAPSDAMLPWCDSFSPSYLVPLGLMTLSVILARRLVADRNRIQRMVPLAIGGLVGGASFLLMSRQCLAGPFHTLDPIVYRLWYLAVLEGLPITAQKPDLQAMIIAPCLLGLLGTALAMRKATHCRMREAWLAVMIMQLASFTVALSVMRAMTYAHVVALPGNAMLLAMLIASAQKFRSMPLRVIVTAGTCVATPFGAASATAAALDSPNASAARSNQVPDRYRCTTFETLRGIDALPATTLFSPLDIGAHLLVYTHHSVIATGHHRNAEGMKTVLEGLTAPPADARAIVIGSGARYLAFCRGENEVEKYRRLYPNSLITALMAGRTPEWLEPQPMRTGESIKVYRVVG